MDPANVCDPTLVGDPAALGEHRGVGVEPDRLLEQIREPDGEIARPAAAVEQPPAPVQPQLLREHRFELRRVPRPAVPIVRGGTLEERRVVRRQLGFSRPLAADPVAREPQADQADEDRKDETERVRRQREGEQRAEDAADRAHGAEAKRESARSPTPRRRSTRLPTIAVGRITSRDVASAECCENPTASVRNGTMSGPTLYAVLVAFGVVVGVASGLLGVGGGTLIVPFLTLAVGFSQHSAEATSLLVILPTAIVGSLVLRRRGVGDLPLALRFGAVGAVGSVLGALLALALPLTRSVSSLRSSSVWSACGSRATGSAATGRLSRVDAVRPDALRGLRRALPVRPAAVLSAARSCAHEELGLDGSGRLLDGGCGPGILTVRLAYLFEEAVGLDPDAAMLAEGRRVADGRGSQTFAGSRRRPRTCPRPPPGRTGSSPSASHSTGPTSSE